MFGTVGIYGHHGEYIWPAWWIYMASMVGIYTHRSAHI